MNTGRLPCEWLGSIMKLASMNDCQATAMFTCSTALVFRSPLLHWNLRMKQLVNWCRAPWHWLWHIVHAPNSGWVRKHPHWDLGSQWQPPQGILLTCDWHRRTELERVRAGRSLPDHPTESSYKGKTILHDDCLAHLTVSSGWRALCILVSGELGNTSMNGLIVGNTYCPVIASFRGAGSNGMWHRHISRACWKEMQRTTLYVQLPTQNNNSK